MTTTHAMPELPEPRTLSRGDEDGRIQLGYTADQMRAYALAALQSQPAAFAPTVHIKEPYTLAELNARIASNDYNAELLLHHAMLLLNAQPAAAAAGVSDRVVKALLAQALFFKEGAHTVASLEADIRAILALRPQSESEQEKELRRSLAEAQATISERNVEIIELQKRIHRSPQAVPMTDEQALGYWKIAAKASSRYSPAVAYYKGIADAEAHHGITAPAGGEGK